LSSSLGVVLAKSIHRHLSRRSKSEDCPAPALR
jgi:hypothetical protein